MKCRRDPLLAIGWNLLFKGPIPYDSWLHGTVQGVEFIAYYSGNSLIMKVPEGHWKEQYYIKNEGGIVSLYSMG